MKKMQSMPAPKPRPAPPRKAFDWLKWLIAVYTIATGVWCWATPYRWPAVLAFYLGMVGMCAHYQPVSFLGRRLQRWLWLLLGALYALPLTATLWLMMIVIGL